MYLITFERICILLIGIERIRFFRRYTMPLFFVFRRYDVLSLHQDRSDDVCPHGWLDPPHKSVFRNAACEAGVPAHRRIRDAGYILQL